MKERWHDWHDTSAERPAIDGAPVFEASGPFERAIANEATSTDTLASDAGRNRRMDMGDSLRDETPRGPEYRAPRGASKRSVGTSGRASSHGPSLRASHRSAGSAPGR